MGSKPRSWAGWLMLLAVVGSLAAGAGPQVAGFAGVKIVCGITINLTVDVTVLEVGVRVAFFAARVIGGRNVINSGSRFQ